MMRRRDFIAGLGTAATARPLAARAQQPGGTSGRVALRRTFSTYATISHRYWEFPVRTLNT